MKILLDIPNYVCYINHSIDSSGQFWNILTKVFEGGVAETTRTEGIKITIE